MERKQCEVCLRVILTWDVAPVFCVGLLTDPHAMRICSTWDDDAPRGPAVILPFKREPRLG